MPFDTIKQQRRFKKDLVLSSVGGIYQYLTSSFSLKNKENKKRRLKAQLKTQKYHLKRHCASAHRLFGLGRSGAESTIWKAGKVSCQERVVLERIRGTKKAAKTPQTKG